MRRLIKNEKGLLERVSIKEDKSAWVYCLLSFGLVAAYIVASFYFLRF